MASRWGLQNPLEGAALSKQLLQFKIVQSTAGDLTAGVCVMAFAADLCCCHSAHGPTSARACALAEPEALPDCTPLGNRRGLCRGLLWSTYLQMLYSSCSGSRMDMTRLCPTWTFRTARRNICVCTSRLGFRHEGHGIAVEQGLNSR